MYLSHYNFTEKPFQITTDPKFIWLGEKHLEALSTLKYGIVENKGFLLLTGDVGTGKTILINCLVTKLDIKATIATLPDPDLEILDFFNSLAESFKINKKFESKGDFLVHLKDFLHKSHNENKSVLLIIDEAQRLNHKLLEEIRLLSNIELNNKKLINIFFVGQDEFNDILMEERNRAVRQRISLRYNIDPLKKNETTEFIKHRLEVAGAKGNIFTASAIHEIHLFSSGYPRLINVMCDHALLTGYTKGIKKIDAKIIRECAEELEIPTKDRKTEILKPRIENSNDDKEPPKDINEKIDKKDEKSPQFLKMGYITAAALLVLIIIYLLTSLTSKSPPDWSAEELTTRKYKDSLQEEKRSLSAKINGPNEVEILPDDSGDDEEKPKVNTEKFQPSEDKNIVIYFKLNSNELTDEAFKTLHQIAEYMIHSPEANITIKGYTDSTGHYRYNVNVSKFRANIIKSYLVGKGVDSSKIESLGLGPAHPVATNSTAEGRRANRRVEIEFN
ncbi:MAG: AAA family ATPase [Deltaproteobacteria bacterium]|nr:AAA family ATPase [Deltaproteobacteria bacterium]